MAGGWRILPHDPRYGCHRTRQIDLIALDDPEYLGTLDADIANFFTVPMSFPKDTKGKSSSLLTTSTCKTLSVILARSSTCQNAIAQLGDSPHSRPKTQQKPLHTVYRRAPDQGENLRQQPPGSKLPIRPCRCVGSPYPLVALDNISVKTSRLVTAHKISIFPHTGAPLAHDVHIKIYSLPIREWSNFHAALSEIGVFNDQNVTILRNDREVFVGTRHQARQTSRTQHGIALRSLPR